MPEGKAMTTADRTTCWLSKALIQTAKDCAACEGKGETYTEVIEQELAVALERRRKRALRTLAARVGDLGGEG